MRLPKSRNEVVDIKAEGVASSPSIWGIHIYDGIGWNVTIEYCFDIVVNTVHSLHMVG